MALCIVKSMDGILIKGKNDSQCNCPIKIRHVIGDPDPPCVCELKSLGIPWMILIQVSEVYVERLVLVCKVFVNQFQPLIDQVYDGHIPLL
jgi:hypothetical protein